MTVMSGVSIYLHVPGIKMYSHNKLSIVVKKRILPGGFKSNRKKMTSHHIISAIRTDI